MKFDPPAYHLRTNKNVERFLFTELLRRIGPHLPCRMERYRYVGLGGPYLEDFAIVQTVLGCRRMTSLEVSPHVVSRQKFNRPHCRIRLTDQSTGVFSELYETRKEPLVVWFDYTKHDWQEQIKECCTLITKLPSVSVFKVTFKNTPKKLFERQSSDVVQERVNALSEKFDRYGPFDRNSVSEDGFPKTLVHIFKRAMLEAMGDTAALCARPLCSFLYSDKTPMLTITVLVGRPERVGAVIEASEMSRWPFADLTWSGPVKIDVPNLSLRERLAIDRHLPDCDAASIAKRLKLVLGETEDETVSVIERYVGFARHIPLFMRMAL